MKKIYKAPLVKVVKINAEQMICESVFVRGDYNKDNMTIAGKDKWEDFDELEENLW